MPHFTRRPSKFGLVFTLVCALATYWAATSSSFSDGPPARWELAALTAGMTLLCPYVAFRPGPKEREEFWKMYSPALDALQRELGYYPYPVKLAPRKATVDTQPPGTEGYVPFDQLMIFSGGGKGQAALSGTLKLGRWSRTNTVLVYHTSEGRRFAVQMGEPTTLFRQLALRGDEYTAATYLGVVGVVPKPQLTI